MARSWTEDEIRAIHASCSPLDQRLVHMGLVPPLPEEPEPPSKLPDQVEMAIQLLESGMTEIQVRLELQRAFKDAARPKAAFNRAMAIIVAEQQKRHSTPELIQAVRWKCIQGAIRDRSWAAAASMLRDAGAVAGELAPERVAEAAARLSITVEAAPPPDQLPSSAETP